MNNIYIEISNKLNLPIEVVKLAYISYFEFIRKSISELPTLNVENFKNYRTSFNIPSIGKLYYNEKQLKKIQEKL